MQLHETLLSLARHLAQLTQLSCNRKVVLRMCQEFGEPASLAHAIRPLVSCKTNSTNLKDAGSIGCSPGIQQVVFARCDKPFARVSKL